MINQQLSAAQTLTENKTRTITTQSNIPKPPVNHQVSIISGAFSPNLITVKVGDTVTWTNYDHSIHSITSGMSGVDDPNLGKEFGSIDYYFSIVIE